jgi:tetratricopeptide (TPR) repeat protein
MSPEATPYSHPSDTNPKTFLCPNDHNPIPYPELIDDFTVPDDMGPTFDLLEGRFNTTVCPLCRERITIAVPLVVRVPEAKLLILHTAGGDTSLPPDVLAKVPPDLSVRTAKDYNELRVQLLPELNRWIVPPLQSLLSGEFEKLARPEQVALLTPLFLRILKSQLDGFLPPVLQFSGTQSPESAAKIIRDLYVATLSAHLDRICREAARERRLLQLHEVIVALIPKECCTTDVLTKVADRCFEVVNPFEQVERFTIGLRTEFLNAEVHAHAGAPNPRVHAWARYIAMVWYLSRRPTVELDPQMKLSRDIVGRTLPFGAFWDAVVPYLQLQIEKKDLDAGDFAESVAAMAKHFGFEEEILRLGDEAGTILNTRVRTPEARVAYVQAVRETLRQEARWNEAPTQSDTIGTLVASVLHNLIASSAASEGLTLVEEFFAAAVEERDYIAIESLASHAAQILNRFEFYGPASDLLARASDVLLPRLDALSPHRAVSFLNELGNAARYRHTPEAALEAYELATHLLEYVDEDQRARDAAVLRRNKAIVLREMGRYSEALALLRREEGERPDDSAVHHSLAVLFFSVGRAKEALRHIDRALETYKGTTRSPIRLDYLATRGHLRGLTGDLDGGLADLVEALHKMPEQAFAVRARLMASILAFPASPETSNRRASVRLEAEQLLAAAPNLSESHRVTLETQIAADVLRTGDVSSAARILERLDEHLAAENMRRPWQLSHQLGEVYLRNGDLNRSWDVLSDALARVQQAVPQGEDARFAPFWLFDKAALQETATRVALERARAGALDAAAELLEVFDFANGREIAARFVSGTSDADRQPLLRRFLQTAAALPVPVSVFFFPETGGRMQMACVSSASGNVAVASEFAVDVAAVAAARREFAEVMRRVNPANPGAVNARMGAWLELAERIGRELSAFLRPAEHVCFLPGRALSGLPLHLVPLVDGASLLDRHTVSFAPNFAVLLTNAAPMAANRRTTIVNVPKASDGTAFRQRAHKAAETLRAMLEGAGETRLLAGTAAARDAVLRAMTDSTEIVFLCHGRHANFERGVAICVSDGTDLPPAVIAVQDIPDHFRFLLTWEDVAQAPAVVVSIACSSAISEIGPAGVRFGLEQTLFSSGTRALVSPLWDIDQHAALAWLTEFYGTRRNIVSRTIAEAYRHASLAMTSSFPHFYHWGCFTVNGSLQGVLT